MVNYKIVIHKQAKKDIEKMKNVPALNRNAKSIIELLQEDPFATPPFYESLLGDLKGMYSRRLNKQHRIIYTVDDNNKIVYILQMWTHYE